MFGVYSQTHATRYGDSHRPWHFGVSNTLPVEKAATSDRFQGDSREISGSIGSRLCFSSDISGSIRRPLAKGVDNVCIYPTKRCKRRCLVANRGSFPRKWPPLPWNVAGSCQWTQRLNQRCLRSRLSLMGARITCGCEGSCCGGEYPCCISGFRVQGSEFRVQGFGLWAEGLGFRVQGLGFRV